MKINKDLLTHDGVTVGTGTYVGKVIDLGFNGDFDPKKTDWNSVFVQCSGGGGNTTCTAIIYSTNENIGEIVDAGNKIGEITVSADVVQHGGVIGIQMPMGLKRYFTIVLSGTSVAAAFTAGITDTIDTAASGINWLNYKAATAQSEVRQKSENVGEVINGTVHEAINS